METNTPKTPQGATRDGLPLWWCPKCEEARAWRVQCCGHSHPSPPLVHASCVVASLVPMSGNPVSWDAEELGHAIHRQEADA